MILVGKQGNTGNHFGTKILIKKKGCNYVTLFVFISLINISTLIKITNELN